MAGHGPRPVIAAVERQLAAGHHHDAPDRGRGLGRRGAHPPVRAAAWQFTLTATDANRFSLRLARAITGRPFVAVHEYCYHGSVDETFAVLDPPIASGGASSRGGATSGRPVDPAVTTRVVPFNDLDALDAALARRQVAALLIEPALTNVGIVLPEPGYLEGVREITRRHGTILIHDETHTICAGPGGVTGARRLAPDMLVIGKTIGGGIPVGDVRHDRRDRRSRARRGADRGCRRRRDRRHARGLRAVDGRRPGDARRGPHRRGVRADDPARGALGARRQRGDRRATARPGA